MQISKVMKEMIRKNHFFRSSFYCDVVIIVTVHNFNLLSMFDTQV
ncbi:MAG: hypothetical protein R3Y54_03930 [Eubacteriales bacterium]